MTLAPILAWIAEFVVLSAAVAGLAHLTRERLILALAATSLGLRLVVGNALYVISAWKLPLFSTMQLEGGFWKFAPDAVGFQQQAMNAAAAMSGQPASDRFVDQPFAWFLGSLYRVVGTSAFHGLLIEASFAAMCIPLAYLAGCWAKIDRKAALAGAAIIGLWPSSFAWSSQILKDSSLWFAIFAIIAGTAGLLNLDEDSGVLAVGAQGGLLLMGSLMLAWLRGYVGLVWVLSALLAAAVFLFRSNGNRKPRKFVLVAVLLGAGLMGAIPARTTIAQLLDSGRSAVTGIHQHSSPSSPATGNSAGTASATTTVENHQPASQGSASGSDGHVIMTQAGPLPAWLAALTPEQRQALLDGNTLSLGERRAVIAAARGTYVSTASGAAVGPPPLGNCPPIGPLLSVRRAFLATGGASLIDAGARFPSCKDILAYVPRALEIVYVAPTPWSLGNSNPTSSGGTVGRSTYSAGALRYLGIIDGLMLWILFPGLIVGATQAVKQSNPVLLALVAYLVILGFCLGLAVLNFGTLFRLRLEAVLPAVLLACAGWSSILRSSTAESLQKHMNLGFTLIGHKSDPGGVSQPSSASGIRTESGRES